MPRSNNKADARRRPRPLRNMSSLTTRFVSSDYCGVLNSQTTQTITGFNGTNPLGNTNLFPRAGHVAKLYTQFKFTSLSFRFVGRSSPNVTANLCAVFYPQNGFGGAVGSLTEFIIKDSPGHVVVPTHRTKTMKVPCSSPWLSVDSNALAVQTGASLGQLFTCLSATPVAGDAQWDMYVDYSLVFRGPIPAGVQN